MLKILERVAGLRRERRVEARLKWDEAVGYLADLSDDAKPSAQKVAELDELLECLGRSTAELEEAVLTKRKRRELAARLGDRSRVEAEIREHEAAMNELAEEERRTVEELRKRARTHYDAAAALSLQTGAFSAAERELILTAPPSLKARQEEITTELADLRDRMAGPLDLRERISPLVEQLRERLARAEAAPGKKYTDRNGDELQMGPLPVKAERIRQLLQARERDLAGVLTTLEPLEARQAELLAERAKLAAAALIP